jgi:hypothetical protein
MKYAITFAAALALLAASSGLAKPPPRRAHPARAPIAQRCQLTAGHLPVVCFRWREAAPRRAFPR